VLRGARVLDESKEKEITDRISREVDEATEFAESAPSPEPESALRHVLVDGKGN
jgi:2-oxoisovalerate dehydrogenase E1 component alpha subunit